MSKVLKGTKVPLIRGWGIYDPEELKEYVDNNKLGMIYAGVSAKCDLNLVTSPESGSILGQIWESAYLVNSSDSPKKVKKRQYMKTELIPKLKSMGAEKLPEEELFEYIVTADISALQKMLQKNPGMINAMYHGQTVFTAICDAVCRFGLTQYDDIIELFIRLKTLQLLLLESLTLTKCLKKLKKNLIGENVRLRLKEIFYLINRFKKLFI